jgi:5S rRNA maturation endonuclease (ribonuclease M5)
VRCAIRCAAETVIIVEGEKDADTLAKLGFTTTTNIGGAGKWRDEYSETLRGKNVIVIGDNDEAGRAHVALVIKSLTGIVRSLRHVTLPAEFKDVSELILSMSVEQALAVIEKLIADAPEIEPPEPVDVKAAPSSPPPYVPPPLDLFPDKMQRFIRAGAATFDVDRAFFLLPVLSGAAAIIGNSRSIRLKEDYIESAIIWTATIAPTGDGKSPVLQAATAPVRMREIGLIKKNKDADKTFEGDFAKWEAGALNVLVG